MFEQTRIDNLKAIDKLQKFHLLLIQAKQIYQGLEDLKTKAIKSQTYPSDCLFIDGLNETLQGLKAVREMIEDDLADLKEERKKAA